MKIHTIYGDHPNDPGSAPAKDEVSLTKQSERDSCDINKIVEKYERTGTLPPGRTEGVYADLGEAVTYQESLNTVLRAEQAFMDLPARLRSRFNNDPVELLQFLNDPTNRKEAEEIGLVVKRDEVPTPSSQPPAVPPNPVPDTSGTPKKP